MTDFIRDMFVVDVLYIALIVSAIIYINIKKDLK